jgi:HSP20 family protein
MNTLTKFSEQGGLTNLHDRVSRLVSDLFGEDLLASGERAWVPALDIMDTGEALVVSLELPGIDPATVEITVTGDYLEISGEKPTTDRVEGSQWYRFERRTGAFRRRIHLPWAIDSGSIEASAKHGLMTIRLPKTPEVLPKKVKVKVK